MIDRPDGFVANRGNCGIVATAIVAGVSYDVAKAALKKAMHKLYPSRKRMGTATTYAQRNLALSYLATKHVDLGNTAVGWRIWEFCAHVAKPDVTYMVCYKGHVFTVRNGYVCDQNYNGPVQNWNKRNRAINRPVIEIIGKGW